MLESFTLKLTGSVGIDFNTETGFSACLEIGDDVIVVIELDR